MPVDRKVVLTKNAPGPSPHNSQAIVSSGPFIFVSGQLGIDVQTGRFVQGSIENRVRVALSNMKTVLQEGGSDLGKIVKCNVYITDMANYVEVNEAYKAILPDPRPARTCICVKELPGGTDVEIECVAQLC